MMKAGRKERINETELSQLARIKPCGIMHVTKTKKDSVIYTCPANINLTDRLKKAISKYDFFFMIEQIVIMVEDVYNNGLNVNSVRFNMDDVYINEMTKEMYFYIFSDSRRTGKCRYCRVYRKHNLYNDTCYQ